MLRRTRRKRALWNTPGLAQIGVPSSRKFLDRRSCGKHEATQILAQLEFSGKQDLFKAIERAHRCGTSTPARSRESWGTRHSHARHWRRLPRRAASHQVPAQGQFTALRPETASALARKGGPSTGRLPEFWLCRPLYPLLHRYATSTEFLEAHATHAVICLGTPGRPAPVRQCGSVAQRSARHGENSRGTKLVLKSPGNAELRTSPATGRSPGVGKRLWVGRAVGDRHHRGRTQ